MKKLVLTILLCGLISTFSYSQTATEAAELYNAGIQIINDNPAGALKEFEKCIEMCKTVGEEANSTKQIAESQIPTCYYKIAYEFYQNKQIEKSLEAFKKASEIAEKYGDNELKKKADDYIPKLYYVIGLNSYKNQKLDEALLNYKKAAELDPAYAKAYYGQAIIYNKKDDDKNALVACEKAIETGAQTNDMKTIESAGKIGHNICLKQGLAQKDKANYEGAIVTLKKALTFDGKSSQAYYLMAVCYNQLSNFEDAIKAANQALGFEDGNDEKKAPIYFEIGTANKKSGDVTAACGAFKNALYGAYTENAKYQIEVVLKCQ